MLVLGIIAATAILAAAPEERVREAVRAVLPEAATVPVEVRPTALHDLFEAAVGTRVLYVTGDGKYLLAGPLYALAEGRNLTEERLDQQRSALLARSEPEPRIVYEPAEPRYRVTVVTNVDCPYCKNLHQDLDQYLQRGIALEYVMTPFGGPGSPGYQKTAQLLCAEDPADAITRAMTLGAVPASDSKGSSCNEQLDQHMRLARDLGAATTPNFILPDGRLVAGYLPAVQLLQMLERR